MTATVTEKFLTILLGEPCGMMVAPWWKVGDNLTLIMVGDRVVVRARDNYGHSTRVCDLPTEGRVHHFLHAIGFTDFAFAKEKVK